MSAQDEAFRCLFCFTTTGKRSREHVFRKAFKKTISSSRGLSFSNLSSAGREQLQRPISQFDMTVNEVCRECNQGWLNELENAVDPILSELLKDFRSLTHIGVENLQILGTWAFIRGLLRTYISPVGRVPSEIFAQVYGNRQIPRGCYVQVGGCTDYVMEAGSHQSVRLHGESDSHYLSFVAFGLGGLVFLVAISDSSGEASRRALDVARRPRLWFPDSFCWLNPPESRLSPLRVLSGDQAKMAGLSLALRAGIVAPLDQFGRELDPSQVVPKEFLERLSWSDVRAESDPSTW